MTTYSKKIPKSLFRRTNTTYEQAKRNLALSLVRKIPIDELEKLFNFEVITDDQELQKRGLIKFQINLDL